MASSLNRIHTAMAAAVVASAGSAAADTLAINFMGTGYAATGAPVTADAYGVAAADWNNVDAANGNGTTTVDGVTFDWFIANDWNQNGAPTAGDGEVNFGYLDDTVSGGVGASVDVSGLAAWLAGTGDSAYTITLVQSSDNATSFTDVVISDGGTLDTLTNPLVAANGAVGGATTTSIGLTNNDLTLTPDLRNGAQRGTISAIIITSVPEPGSLALLGLGGLAILRRRRG